MEHRSVSLADQVFERLENEILCGTYPRGEILTELKLSEDLGVSRTPIREAIRRLEQEHIVELSAKGLVVLGVSAEDVRDIFEIRLRIEPLAAALAAAHADKKNIAPLAEAIDMQEYYVYRHNPDQIKYMDSRFHELLFRLSQSTIFFDTLLPLHKKAQKYRRASMQSQARAERSLIEHKEIFRAIRENDRQAAEDAMRRHIENAMIHLERGDL